MALLGVVFFVEGSYHPLGDPAFLTKSILSESTSSLGALPQQRLWRLRSWSPDLLVVLSRSRTLPRGTEKVLVGEDTTRAGSSAECELLFLVFYLCDQCPLF